MSRRALLMADVIADDVIEAEPVAVETQGDSFTLELDDGMRIVLRLADVAAAVRDQDREAA